MADYLPQASGLWSTTTWITAFSNLTAFAGGNTPPTIIDDVYADGKSIRVDISTAVRSIRTTIAPRTAGFSGGSFLLSNNVSFSADGLAGPTSCITFDLNTPNTATVIGNLTGASFDSGNQRHGISVTGTGTLNIIGSVKGGGAPNNTCHGINIGTTAVVNITGNIFGGSSNTNEGARLATNGCTLNLVGNAYGGTISNCPGILVFALNTLSVSGNIFGSNAAPGIRNFAGNVTVYGNVSGGLGASGISNEGTTSVYVYGDAYGNSAAAIAGISNTSTGLVYVTKAVGNGFGLGSVGIGGVGVGLANSQNGKAYVEQVEFGPRGATPISGPVYIVPSNQNTLVGYTTALGQTVTFYNSLSVSGLIPPANSVRSGVIYNVGNSTGTMAVPSASAVQFGVAVDNTVGTAALTPQNVWGYARLSATEPNSLGDRLRNTATTQSVGQQIASFNL